MDGTRLAEECTRRGIPLPGDVPSVYLENALRVRLKAVSRWAMSSDEHIKNLCEERYFDTAKKTREQMLKFLKSFEVLPKPPTPSKKGDTDTGSSDASPAEDGSSVDISMRLQPCISERVKNIFKKFPAYSGPITPKMARWTYMDIRMFVETEGLICPEPVEKMEAPELPPVSEKEHYQTLGVPEGSTPVEMRKRMQHLAHPYHSDNNKEDPDTAQQKLNVTCKAHKALVQKGVKSERRATRVYAD